MGIASFRVPSLFSGGKTRIGLLSRGPGREPPSEGRTELFEEKSGVNGGLLPFLEELGIREEDGGDGDDNNDEKINLRKIEIPRK